MPLFLLLIYCVLVAFASLAGGWLPSLIEMTHLRKQLLMSFVSGVMLGVAALHMLPLAIDELQSSVWVGGSLMCGVLVMFLLIRVFHAHPHGAGDGHDHDALPLHDHDHNHDHDHDHGGPKQQPAKEKQLSWSGLLVGMTIHSILDGAALAVSMRVETGSHATWTLLGLGTFFAIFLHKPLDALAVTSLMHATHWSQSTRGMVNSLFALTCPIGAFAFWFGADLMGEQQGFYTGVVLAFSAGFFLCIALSDLLPEVAFHTHDRGKLSFALVLGVALACGVEMMHSHDHEHEHDQSGEANDKPHEHHEH